MPSSSDDRLRNALERYYLALESGDARRLEDILDDPALLERAR